MKKLIVIVTLFALIMLPCSVFAEDTALVVYSDDGPVFNDIADHWAEKIIISQTRLGFLNGYPDGSFRPDNPLSNAELIVLINRYFGLKNSINSNFIDVNENDWYFNEAAIAWNMEYTDKIALNPNSNASREELVGMLSRLIDTDEEGALKDDTTLIDISDAEGHLRRYITKFAILGYITGYPDGTFKPKGNISRAEVLVIFNNILGYVVNSQQDLENVPVDAEKVTIITGGLDFSGKRFLGDVFFTAGVSDEVVIENFEVRGKLIISADSGANEILLKNVRAGKVILTGNFNPQIVKLDSCSIDRLKMKNESEVFIVQSHISFLDVFEKCEFDIDLNSSIHTLESYAETKVTGHGLVTKAIIKHTDVSFSKKPTSIEIESSIPGLWIAGNWYTGYIIFMGHSAKVEVSQGTGTIADPYKIYKIEDLASIGKIHYETGELWSLGSHYIMMGDLDFNSDASYTDSQKSYDTDWNGDGLTLDNIKTQLTNTSGLGWLPIGTRDLAFTGSFDGNSNRILNLYFYRDDFSDLGMFGKTFNASISNINLINVNITGDGDLGALIGEHQGYYGIVKNCTVSGNVNGKLNGNSDDVGSLIGDFEHGIVLDCSSTANVQGNAKVGGLLGELEDGKILNSFATGDVFCDNYRAGGLVGNVFDSSLIAACYATGNVEAEYKGGGLVGSLRESRIENSYAMGDVTVIYDDDSEDSEYSKSGGLVGYIQGSVVKYCYATGDVYGELSGVGGLVGHTDIGKGNTANLVYDCYASGDVIGDNDYTGGLIGLMEYTDVYDVIAFNGMVNGADLYVDRVFGDYSDSYLWDCYANANMSDGSGAFNSLNINHDEIGGANILTIDNDNFAPLSNWDFSGSYTDGDKAFWQILNNRPVLYVDMDGDGLYNKLGPDDGTL